MVDRNKVKAMHDKLEKAKAAQEAALKQSQEAEQELKAVAEADIAELPAERGKIDETLKALGYGVKRGSSRGKRTVYPVGTVFHKEYAGKSHKCVVVAEGFKVDGGTVYSSLTAAAIGASGLEVGQTSGKYFWKLTDSPATKEATE